MRILRHELEITDYQEIRVPEGELLSVAASRSARNSAIDLWSLDLETGWTPDTSGIYVVGTGNPMPPQLETQDEEFRRTGTTYGKSWRKFLGTVVTPSGLVWHVFVGPRIEQAD